MKSIYLDHASTTPVDPKVLKVMSFCNENVYGNAGSLHQIGRNSAQVILNARENIAKILNCKPQEIIFIGSGTESDNLAILGIARANKNFGKNIVTTNIEHHAVINPCKQLEKEGFKINYLSVNKDGIVELESVKKAIVDDTVLVSIIYANNEIGTIQPIKEIGEIINNVRQDRIKRNIKTPIYFHTDACQATGYLDINVIKLGVDLMTINASKIYGPKGVGVLYSKLGNKIDPIVFGGGQERGFRSGTENISGIVGLAKALEIANQIKDKELKRETKLRDYFIKGLLSKIDRVFLNGHAQKRLPNNINVAILDVEGEAMLLWLDKYGICVSTGSACDSQSLDPSHVILALGRPYEYANGSLRFTLGRGTTKKDIDFVLKVLPKIVKDLRKISPVKVKVD